MFLVQRFPGVKAGVLGLTLALTGLSASAQSAEAEGGKSSGVFEPFKVETRQSTGAVTINGQSLNYQAVAGNLIIHPRGWDDVAKDPKNFKADTDAGSASAVASMFYVAYFKQGGGNRPLVFMFNGGPGSSSFWLHMGSFGPKRVVVSLDTHTPAAPYNLVNNPHSILDVADVVFIDAPGTGFSRIAGKDAEKAFFGIDQDAYAFSEFITQFLTHYGRWNSPKFIIGESYGTPRAAVLVNLLQNERSVDVNGVVLVSQILNFDLSPDGPSGNPGIDTSYVTSLPTYAATAFYHHKVTPTPASLESFIKEAEDFALGEYTHALAKGADLTASEKQAVAQKLSHYTGLSVDYVLKADLRIDGGEFRQELMKNEGKAAGRLDTRFSGPLLEPLAQRVNYDPQSTAISSPYVSLYNDYVRKELKMPIDAEFKPSIGTYRSWNWQHAQPGSMGAGSRQGANVMPDLANAMKTNPNLKVQLNAGYFDLATPFFQGVYELKHLPIPAELQNNIEYQFYDSGHMMYAKESSLKTMHDAVANFISKNATH